MALLGVVSRGTFNTLSVSVQGPRREHDSALLLEEHRCGRGTNVGSGNVTYSSASTSPLRSVSIEAKRSGLKVDLFQMTAVRKSESVWEGHSTRQGYGYIFG